MKEIIFIRHAKSDWGTEYLKDIDRHLNERGYSDAYYTSTWFAENQQAPDLMLSSSATRALSTALIFARTLNIDMKNFRLERDLYESAASTIFDIIHRQPDSKNRLMIVSHNPGITNICNLLADTYFDNIPTCGMVAYKFAHDSWKDIEPKKGELDFYRFPKDFRNKD